MGDKICVWIEAEFPLLVRWIGGMSEWEAVAFAAALMVFMYLIYAAAWNAWLYAAGMLRSVPRAGTSACHVVLPKGGSGGRLAYYPADLEDYEPWMDYEKWRDA